MKVLYLRQQRMHMYITTWHMHKYPHIHVYNATWVGCDGLFIFSVEYVASYAGKQTVLKVRLNPGYSFLHADVHIPPGCVAKINILWPWPWPWPWWWWHGALCRTRPLAASQHRDLARHLGHLPKRPITARLVTGRIDGNQQTQWWLRRSVEKRRST